ncbi:hypothetical protein D3C73_278420 [compost metagenome]
MKQEFLTRIETGKWFEVKGKYGATYAVKLKANARIIGHIDALWLSYNDQESMTIEEYSEKDWTYEGGIFVIQGAGVYHFGSFEADDDSIYDDGYNIIERKMFDVIIKNAPDGLIEEVELKEVWSKLINEAVLGFDILEVQN